MKKGRDGVMEGKMRGRLIIAAKIIVYGFALLFLFFLSIASFVHSSDGYEVHINDIWRVLRDLGGCAFFFGFCWLLAWFMASKSKVLRMAGGLFLFSGAMYFSWWWIINSANLPQSDAKAVYDIALRAKNHDLLPFAPTGSYMSLWPFQSGLVLFFEIIFRLVSDANEMTIQMFYLPFMALSLISGYMIVRKSFSSVRTRIIWCLLMFFCFPYYFYINNMYGEVPGIAMCLFALWMLLEYSSRPSWYKLLFAGLGGSTAVAIRKNSIIFIIACILVWIVVYIGKRRQRYLSLILVLGIAAAAGIILPARFYEYRAKNTMGSGVPAIAYIAMGMQWSEGRSPGSWNGYHSDLFMECNYNTELTSRIAADSVNESLKYMKNNPGYMAKFYYYKQIDQWEREDYGCFYATLAFCGERTSTAWKIYGGKAKEGFLSIMSVHQSLVYLGAECFCVLGAVRWRNRKKNGIDCSDEAGGVEKLVLLVTFIGGFLFSLLWEASPRYNLPYFVMLMPYSAEGIAAVSYRIEAFAASLRHCGIGGREL